MHSTTIRKRLALLATTMLFAMLAIASTPALAATQKYTCTYNDQTRTITQSQYEKLVAEYGSSVVDQFCVPLR